MNGAELLDEVVDYLSPKVLMGPSEYAVLALWTVHSHTLEAAYATPYMHVSSATRESGKTRVAESLVHLVKEPLSTSNTSTAALFRAIHTYKPTIFFDETDATFNAKTFDEEKRGILNAGYKRGAFVLRMGGKDKTKLERFDPFGPKMLIGLGGLPDTLESRSIPVRLKKKFRSERVERTRDTLMAAEAKPIKARIEEWAVANLEQLREARPEDLLEISDRHFEVWEPLLAIADLAGGDWPERARNAAKKLCGNREVEDDSLSIQLLSDIRYLFAGHDHIGSTELVTGLKGLDESPWAELCKNGLTAHRLARMLRPFDVHPHQRWVDEKTRRGYWLDQLSDPFERYLPVNVGSEWESGRNGSTMRVCGDSESGRQPNAYHFDNGDFPLNQADPPGLPLQASDTGAGGSNGDVPAPGDHGFRAYADRAAFRGLITWAENHELQAHHDVVVRSRTAREEAA